MTFCLHRLRRPKKENYFDIFLPFPSNPYHNFNISLDYSWDFIKIRLVRATLYVHMTKATFSTASNAR